MERSAVGVAARVKRQGVVNAWDDPAFADACRNTGKRNLVMAGVTTDVCMVAPAISAVAEGFDVQVVCDAWLDQPDRRRDVLSAHGSRRGSPDQQSSFVLRES